MCDVDTTTFVAYIDSLTPHEGQCVKLHRSESESEAYLVFSKEFAVGRDVDRGSVWGQQGLGVGAVHVLEQRAHKREPCKVDKEKCKHPAWNVGQVDSWSVVWTWKKHPVRNMGKVDI